MKKAFSMASATVGFLLAISSRIYAIPSLYVFESINGTTPARSNFSSVSVQSDSNRSDGARAQEIDG